MSNGNEISRNHVALGNTPLGRISESLILIVVNKAKSKLGLEAKFEPKADKDPKVDKKTIGLRIHDNGHVKTIHKPNDDGIAETN